MSPNNWASPHNWKKEFVEDFLQLDQQPPVMPTPPNQDQSMTTNLDEIFKERGKRYGTFKGHAEITQHLKNHIRLCTPTCRVLPSGDTGPFLARDQQEALDMICHKIGGILNGDPDYAGSWYDIAGYAQLVADRLEGVER